MFDAFGVQRADLISKVKTPKFANFEMGHKFHTKDFTALGVKRKKAKMYKKVYNANSKALGWI